MTPSREYTKETLMPTIIHRDRERLSMKTELFIQVTGIKATITELEKYHQQSFNIVGLSDEVYFKVKDHLF